MRVIGLNGNGARKILIGGATTIFTLAAIGGVSVYSDVQEMKSSRFTNEDFLQSVIDRKQEVRASLDSLETRLRVQIELVEGQLDELRLLHLQQRTDG